MRIGIFGGTFNPVHLGHLRSAEEVREGQGLDRVLFVPSAHPPHKQAHGLASAAERLAMVRLAVAGNPAFRVSEIEFQRSGRSYSVDTIRALRQRMPRADFAFILGVDAFREIGTWHDHESLFGMCDLIVTSRPPIGQRSLRAHLPVVLRKQFCYPGSTATLRHRSGHHIFFQPLTSLDISATAIRSRILRGLSVRYLVPPAVHRYLELHRLYLRREATA